MTKEEAWKIIEDQLDCCTPTDEIVQAREEIRSALERFDDLLSDLREE